MAWNYLTITYTAQICLFYGDWLGGYWNSFKTMPQNRPLTLRWMCFVIFIWSWQPGGKSISPQNIQRHKMVVCFPDLMEEPTASNSLQHPVPLSTVMYGTNIPWEKIVLHEFTTNVQAFFQSIKIFLNMKGTLNYNT